MARLTEEEKKKIYAAYAKKMPSDNAKYLIALGAMMIVLAGYYELIPRIAWLIADKGWAHSANNIALLTYAIYMALMAPVAALSIYINKKRDAAYQERRKLVRKANSELFNELYNKEGHSDWEAVVEKYKDI